MDVRSPCSGCLAPLLIPPWKTVHLFMSLPGNQAPRHSCAATRTEGKFCHQRVKGERRRGGEGGIKACVHACEPECIELSSVEKFCEWPRVCVGVSLSICVCVVPCAYSVWHPLTRGKYPADMKPLFSVKLLFCTKGSPLRARLFRKIRRAARSYCDSLARGFMSLVRLMGTRFCVDFWGSRFCRRPRTGVRSLRCKQTTCVWNHCGSFQHRR